MVGDIIFRSPNGDLPINTRILSKYPNCLLRRAIDGPMNSKFDPTTNICKTDIDLHTLKLVKDFLTNGVWKNPHIRGNQLSAIIGDHDQNCEYLQLPDYPIGEIPDDPEYEWELYDELNAELNEQQKETKLFFNCNWHRLHNIAEGHPLWDE